MTRISATLRLRPTRIGLLVRPSDLPSIRRFMRLATCFWGGTFNPIIPVSEASDPKWHPDFPDEWGPKLTQDHLDFFEPDIFFEAEEGLAKQAGLGELSRGRSNGQVFQLNDIYALENERRAPVRVGTDVRDIYADIHKTEGRFQLRDDVPWLIFKPSDLDPFVESTLGAFPSEAMPQEVEQQYRELLRAEETELNSDLWLSLIKGKYRTPFVATRHELRITSAEYGRPIFFIFNPFAPGDLIQYWNCRQFKSQLIPIPSQWLGDLAPFIGSTLTEIFKVDPRRPNHILDHGSMQFAGSMSAAANELLEQHFGSIDRAALWPDSSYDWIGAPEAYGEYRGPLRFTISAGTAEVALPVLGEKNEAAAVSTLSPVFAKQFGRAAWRWVNVIDFHRHQNDNSIATVFPLAMNRLNGPRLDSVGAEDALVSREGLVLEQRYSDWKLYLRLKSGTEAVMEWFKTFRFKAKRSGAGRIADEMLRSIGGLHGTHLICDEATVKLLNKMAVSRVELNNIEQQAVHHYEGKSATLKEWEKVLARRAETFRKVEPSELSAAGIMRLGLSVDCSYCAKANWYGLDQVDYEIPCERCLRRFKFPEGAAQSATSWKYRVIGSFSVPNYAEGAYGVALSLRALAFRSEDFHRRLTYGTGIELTDDTRTSEVDFVAWTQSRGPALLNSTPRIILGEAKSFGKNVFKEKDVDSLQHVAGRVPGAAMAVTFLKTTLDPEEITRLRNLARWGWGETVRSPMSNPLVILTGHELFAQRDLSAVWNELGGVHAVYSDRDVFTSIERLARATQKIYLNIAQDDAP